MNSRRRLNVLWLVFAAVLMAAGFWAFRDTPPPAPVAPAPLAPVIFAPTPAPAPEPAPAAVLILPPAPEPLAAATPGAPEEPLPERPPQMVLHGGILPWESALQEVLRTPTDPGGKAKVLLSMLPRLPISAVPTATEEALKWLRDPDYAQVALPLITNPATDGAIMSVMFSDLMERPDPIALPALLAIARNPQHPFAPYAKDDLSLLLGQDYETDWNAWALAVQRHLTQSGGK